MEPLILAVLLAVLGLAAYVAVRMRRTGEALERLAVHPAGAIHEELGPGRLRNWLVIAGYRSRAAPRTFVLATGAAGVLGAVFALVLQRWPTFTGAVRAVSELPGGIGPVFAPLVAAAPFGVALLFALFPAGVVSSRRSRIVASIERDLPITLELFATLAEAGHGVDAALQRILEAQPGDRPLTRELRTFQRETLSGMPRHVCYRRLSARIDLPNVTAFVSAMIQSERIGATLGATLRRQADDVWNRRRELALMRSQVLPVKMAVPLVLCFLPGIFVYTLGPAFQEFLRMADNLTR